MTTMPINNHPLTQRWLQFLGISVNNIESNTLVPSLLLELLTSSKKPSQRKITVKQFSWTLNLALKRYGGQD